MPSNDSVHLICCTLALSMVWISSSIVAAYTRDTAVLFLSLMGTVFVGCTFWAMGER